MIWSTTGKDTKILFRRRSQQTADRFFLSKSLCRTRTYLEAIVVRLFFIAIVARLSLADASSGTIPTEAVRLQADKSGVETFIFEGFGGKVKKTIVNSKLRVMVMVGLEGTGHHFMRGVYNNMFTGTPNISIDATDCLESEPFYTGTSMVKTTSHYAKLVETARRDMQNIVRQGEILSEPGHLAKLCNYISYPTMFGPQKAMQYLDLGMIAAAAEAEGVDLRVVYFKRPAHDIIIANTVHRNFQDTYDPRFEHLPETASEDKKFIKYMRILLTDIAVVQSFLAEIDPAFIVCHNYDLSGYEEEVSKISHFVAPNDHIAAMFEAAWLKKWKPHSKQEEPLPFESAGVVAARLQRKLDSFEYNYCG